MAKDLNYAPLPAEVRALVGRTDQDARGGRKAIAMQ